MWHIGRRLHQEHYDILINLHPNERTSFLAAAIQAKKFVGMSHFLARPLMNRYTRLDRIHLHAADMYINVLAQLGIDDYRSDGLQFPTSKAWDDKPLNFMNPTASRRQTASSASISAAPFLKNGGRPSGLPPWPITLAAVASNASSSEATWTAIWSAKRREK